MHGRASVGKLTDSNEWQSQRTDRHMTRMPRVRAMSPGKRVFFRGYRSVWSPPKCSSTPQGAFSAQHCTALVGWLVGWPIIALLWSHLEPASWQSLLGEQQGGRTWDCRDRGREGNRRGPLLQRPRSICSAWALECAAMCSHEKLQLLYGHWPDIGSALER